jgi:hypothetical protein
MATETSIEAYNNLVHSGAQSSQQEKVLAMLEFMGTPSTASEVFDRIKTREQLDLRFDNGNIRARLCELRKAGKVRTVGKRACTITGQTVYTWEVTPEGGITNGPQ